MSNLCKFLETLDPRKVLDETEARIDSALNSFPMPESQIESWNAFQETLSRFHVHLNREVLHLGPAFQGDIHFEWGLCLRLLHKEYGKSGEKTAFEIARTGVEGGIYSVLKKVGLRMARQYQDQEIKARVAYFLDGLSLEERWTATEEYIQKHGHLLPSEMLEGSAARIYDRFDKVLEAHPRTLNKLRKAGKRA